MIQLNYRDSRPIYQQIKEGFRQLFISGILPPDEKLPSVRELSSNLAINPNTIQRAYRELEAEGFIYTVPGKGSFAAPVPEPDLKRYNILYKQLEDNVLELLYLGESKTNILHRVTEMVEHNSINHNSDNDPPQSKIKSERSLTHD